jgi:hypothetical protein
LHVVHLFSYNNSWGTYRSLYFVQQLSEVRCYGLEDKDSVPGSGVDFSRYHHIHTSSSVHPTTCGHDALSPVRLKCVTDHWLVLRGLCPLSYIFMLWARNMFTLL